MKRIFLSILIIIAAAIAHGQGASPPAKGIFVLPAILNFNLTTGQLESKTLSIQNRTENSSQFKLYFADWQRDSTGKHQYLNPGLLPNSCSEWVKVDKEFVEVPAGGTLPITVTMKIPDSATSIKEMKWSMLFVEVINEKRAKSDTGVSTGIIPIYRMGIHLYQTPPNLVRQELRMIGFEQRSNAPDSIVYDIICENVGEVHVKAKSSLELTNLTDGVKTKLGPDQFSIFPGARRILRYKFPANLPKGKYSILAILDGGEEMPIEAAEAEIEIK